MTDAKYEGTVKWFSTKSGYGFIAPTSDNAPTKEDIFVHATAIVTESDYPNLKEGFQASFLTYLDENGKLKAKDVTSSDGSPCPHVPRYSNRKSGNRKKGGKGAEDGEEQDAEDGAEGGDGTQNPRGKRNKPRRQKKDGEEGDAEGNGEGDDEGKPRAPKKPVEPSWFATLEASVQESMTSRDIKVMNGSCFLAVGDSAFVKLGTKGYAAMAHSSGVLAEGTYTTAPDGSVTMEWPKIIKADGAEWSATTVEAVGDAAIVELKLTDESLKSTTREDTTEKLWGEGKNDPMDVMEANEFLSKRIVFFDTRNRRRGGNRKYNRKRGPNNKSGGDGAGPAPEAPASAPSAPQE
uniref:CSD domain-containing protein n=1 Tax=Craspedostauros australis TaxID=1486917 RepID=A0A7R9ZQ32_9STRA